MAFSVDKKIYNPLLYIENIYDFTDKWILSWNKN